MNEEKDRVCRTCIHFQEETVSEGTCEYPLPNWLLNTFFKLKTVRKSDGKTCPCWEEKS